jgi:hypothetical protein
MIFLQGSPLLEEKNGVKLGRLSGIVAHFVPKYLQKNRMPSWETNCIEDWETKINAVVAETLHEDMSVISGIPSWVQMYFEKLQEKANKPVGEIFKNFNLFIYGGVNYEPYRAKFENLIGRKVDTIELFPASEGFFAYQDIQKEKGMLLLLNSGIFYEFIKITDLDILNSPTYLLGEIEKDINRLLTITDRFSKIGSEPVLEVRDICTDTKITVDYLQSRVSKQVIFDFSAPQHPVFVAINPALHSWTIENLVKNAIDAMKGKGHLTIQISELEDVVKIKISDTGKGIPKNQFGKVFEPGFTTKKRGWGLGLSLTKRIVQEYHKGKIKVEQSEIGKGTTMQISFKKKMD